MPGDRRRCQTKQFDKLAKAQLTAVERSDHAEPTLIGQGLHYG
jgi:hypothetical protein